ncbi:membrane dipeptidase [Lewinella sp. 4G2]|uniref:membrane dipeptidase n=1 Tax=Lewinella sp. 4G2 TaxID=1803372 RepID=UPI0007B475FC|nr:membrane dipeptidase [Lewinella sp. 4G2]OAV44462.1 hypothetical protein A3850_008150 [Lewinella sp. 4G2]
MFFDLHCHPALKSFLTDEKPEKRDDCWTTYRNCIDFTVGSIIDSQASYRQIERGRTNVAVAALYSFENGLDEIGLIKRIAPIISQLDKDMVSDIKPAAYYDKLMEEVRHLEGSLEPKGGRRPFQIVSRAADIDPEVNNLVLSIEGAHVLTPNEGDDPIAKLDELKRFRHKILYLTLCHFTKNPLCNHAFAMKLVNPEKAPVFFPAGTGLTDLGKRVIHHAYDDSAGRRILLDVKHLSLSGRQQFYDWKVSDAAIKNLPIIASHVGITGHSWTPESRSRLHKEVKYLRALGQVAIKYDRLPGLELDGLQSYFNPASINLYDEDIEAIVQSGGLIGIMMDQRQLGAGKKPFEYFAKEDHDQLYALPTQFDADTRTEGQRMELASDESEVVEDLTQDGLSEYFSLPSFSAGEMVSGLRENVKELFGGEDEGEDQPSTYDTDRRSLGGDRVRSYRKLGKRKRLHLLHIANNLLHVAKIGGAEAWKVVCIGSDFDGLVDAPNNCVNTTEFSELEAHLYEIIIDLIEADGPGFRERYHLGDVRWQLRRVMYDNGREFLDRWL